MKLRNKILNLLTKHKKNEHNIFLTVRKIIPNIRGKKISIKDSVISSSQKDNYVRSKLQKLIRSKKFNKEEFFKIVNEIEVYLTRVTRISAHFFYALMLLNALIFFTWKVPDTIGLKYLLLFVVMIFDFLFLIYATGLKNKAYVIESFLQILKHELDKSIRTK